MDELILSRVHHLAALFDNEAQPHYRQSTKDLYRHFSSKHTISSYMGFVDR